MSNYNQQGFFNTNRPFSSGMTGMTGSGMTGMTGMTGTTGVRGGMNVATTNTSRSAQIESKIDTLTEMVKELKNGLKPTPSVSYAHVGIYCDMCRKKDIVGFRYKCVVCPDYDLCHECWTTKRHEHIIHSPLLWCVVEVPVKSLTISGSCA